MSLPYMALCPDIPQVKMDVSEFLLKQLLHVICFFHFGLIYHRCASPKDLAVISSSVLDGFFLHLRCHFGCRDITFLPSYPLQKWGLSITDNLVLCRFAWDGVLTQICLTELLMLAQWDPEHCWYFLSGDWALLVCVCVCVRQCLLWQGGE